MKFFKGVKEEMSKVTWPSKKQLRKDTLIVVETTVLFGVMFFIMDTAIHALIGLVLR